MNGRGRGRGYAGREGPPNAWGRPQRPALGPQQQSPAGPLQGSSAWGPRQQIQSQESKPQTSAWPTLGQQVPQQQSPAGTLQGSSVWGPRQQVPSQESKPKASAWPTVSQHSRQGYSESQQKPPSRGEPRPSGHGQQKSVPHGEAADIGVSPVPVKSDAAIRVPPSGAGEPSGSLSRKGEELLKTRPDTCVSKAGTKGSKIMVQANYFQLLTKPQFALHQYRVDFEPEEDRTRTKIGILKAFGKNLEPYTFDGAAIFTTKKYPEPLVINGKRRTRNGDEEPIKIKIKFTNVLKVSDPNYIHFFNIVMRKCIAALDLQLVGRDYFDAKAKTSVPEYNFDIWPGFITSIKQHESHVLMNVEMAHKIMRKETAYDFLMECRRRASRQTDYKTLFNALLGQVVITMYNNKTYRIDDIDYDANIMSTFNQKGKDVTFKKYYEEKYQIRLQFSDQPLLVSKPKARDVRGGQDRPILLIPEICHLTGLSEAMTSDQKLMRALANHTRIRPDTRMSKYTSFLSRVNANNTAQKELKTWDLQFSPTLVSFPARVLPNEKITFGKQSMQLQIQDRAEWTSSMKKNGQFRPIPIQSWAIIALQRMKPQNENFIKTLQNASRGLAYAIPPPKDFYIPDDRVASYHKAIEDALRIHPQIILIVLPNNRGDRYSAIKRRCCVDKPVPSQVVLSKNLDGKNTMSIATKIAIQMNCKLGGAPWTVTIPFETPTMVAGYDVCHDTLSKGKSYGALVATTDPNNFSKYYSNVRAHTCGEELSNFLAQQMCEAVSAFRQCNGVFPERIFFYRDGVGEGNLNYVYNHEVQNIKSLLQKMYGPQEVKMIVIVVSKRISTRIFYNQNNPSPGTIVDDCITLPEKYDFFLISQYVQQGTVTPTSYNVISDNTLLHPNCIQQMTYKLCHMYYNWSGTIRVPAPCQYAHKLAFLTAQYLHSSPSQQMSDLLFFL